MDSQVTQADIDCRNAIYKELTGLRVDDDIAAQPDWMDKHLSAHRIAAEARGMAEIERLRAEKDRLLGEINVYKDACANAATAIRAALGGQHE
jgi:hypothetical protein